MEKRTEIRHGLHYQLNIIRDKGDEHFGHLINLSQSGMLICTEQQVSTGESYPMRLILTDDPGPRDIIPVINRVCWTRPKDGSDELLVGCRIEEIPSQYQQAFKDLMVRIAGSEIG